MATVVSKTSETKENFYRLSTLLVDGGSTALRDVFDSIHPPTTLPAVLSNPSNKAKLRAARLARPLLDKLYPSPGAYGKSEDFDITLLALLLRNICYLISPAGTGWNKMPVASDLTLSADITRIKCYRNELYAHARAVHVDNNDFQRLWKELECIFIRLARHVNPASVKKWKEDIKVYLLGPLTPECEQYAKELEEWYRKDVEVKGHIERILHKIGNVERKMQEMASNLERKMQEMASNLERKMQEMASNVEIMRQESSELLKEFYDRISESDGNTTNATLPCINSGATQKLENPQNPSLRTSMAQRENDFTDPPLDVSIPRRAGQHTVATHPYPENSTKRPGGSTNQSTNASMPMLHGQRGTVPRSNRLATDRYNYSKYGRRDASIPGRPGQLKHRKP